MKRKLHSMLMMPYNYSSFKCATYFFVEFFYRPLNGPCTTKQKYSFVIIDDRLTNLYEGTKFIYLI